MVTWNTDYDEVAFDELDILEVYNLIKRKIPSSFIPFALGSDNYLFCFDYRSRKAPAIVVCKMNEADQSKAIYISDTFTNFIDKLFKLGSLYRNITSSFFQFGGFMNISPLIKSKISNWLQEQGFVLEKANRTWLFTRNNVDHIEIFQGNWEDLALRMIFYKQGKRINAINFISDSKVEGFFYYNDIESLIQLLDQFKYIIETYGLSWLENQKNGLNSINNILWNNDLENDFQEFIEENQLKYNDIDSIFKLEKAIAAKQNRFALLFASRFLGEFIIDLFGGEWKENGNYTSGVTNIGDISDFTKTPSTIVENCFESAPNYSIMRHINAIESVIKNR